MSEDKPRISVVIPAYNEEFYLGKTLQSLREAAEFYRQKAGKDIEFIVVDNASTDHTAALAAASGAKVVFEPFRQIASARNRGVREAAGEIVVTCDADNSVSQNLFTRIDEVMSSGRFIGGGVRIRPERKYWAADLMFGIFEAVASALRMSFGVLYADRETFLRVGGFPADVYVGEDALFVLALKREARRQGKSFSNLKDVGIVTSMRKIDEFGALQQCLTYLKFLFMPWTIRRRESCSTWYEVRDGKHHAAR